ncbi:MAG: MotA/TolQ/ExbB proton channel family protein [Balneolales bacterium]|nr:MotA/TolQ/ExbB proton channel family protein [Balneolales bacterium]
MIDLFNTGGPLFMGTLTLIFAAVIAAFVFSFLQIRKGGAPGVSIVKEIGLFGLIIGILGQSIGLYTAFSIIEEAGMISPEILISGLKVSSVTTIYGLIIAVSAYLLYFALRRIEAQNAER